MNRFFVFTLEKENRLLLDRGCKLIIIIVILNYFKITLKCFKISVFWWGFIPSLAQLRPSLQSNILSEKIKSGYIK